MTLELLTGKYRPFHKNNENLRYINKESNHPKSVIKAIVNSVSNRISSLSANEEIFRQNEDYYNEALTDTDPIGPHPSYLLPLHPPFFFFLALFLPMYNFSLAVNNTQKNTHWRKTVSL